MATFSQSLIAIMLSGQIFKKQFLQYQIVIHSKNGINNFSKRFFIPDFLRQIKFVAPHVVSIVEERIFDMTGVKIITRICESSPVYKFHKWSTFWTNDLGKNCLFFLYLLSLIVALILIVARTACWAELDTVPTCNYGFGQSVWMYGEFDT